MRPPTLSHRGLDYDEDHDPLWDDAELSEEVSQYEMSMDATPSKPPRQASQTRFATSSPVRTPHSPVRQSPLRREHINTDKSHVTDSKQEKSDVSHTNEEWESTLNRVSLILDQCTLSPGKLRRQRRNSGAGNQSFRASQSFQAEVSVDWGLASVEKELQQLEDSWATKELEKHNSAAKRESRLMGKMGDDRLELSNDVVKKREKRNSVIVGGLVQQWEAERREEERIRLEEERKERERLEKERLERERLEKERLEKERLEKERLEKERLEKERLAKEKADKEKAEKERLAKEKAAKEEKERLEAEEAARKSKTGQFTNWRNVDKEYLGWKAKIEEIKRDIKEPVANNPELKKLCNQCKRKINPKFGQLTHSVPHTKQISQDLEEIFNQAKQHSEIVYLWLLNFFAKSIIRQAENETIVAPQSALPLGMLAAKIMSVFPECKDLLIARFVKKCPLVIGFTCDIDTEEGRVRMAWRKPNDKWEDETVYSERMGGIASVYAAITQIKFGAHTVDPYPIDHSWTMMARLVNTAADKLTNTHFTVVAAWWEVTATRFLQTYGIQARKMLQAAWDPWTSSVMDKRFPACARLRLIGEEWQSTGQVKGLTPMDK